MNPPSQPRVVFGFLTVRATPTDGIRGGYLLTTQYGRPLEFHYTAEVRLRGPQRLLFGARVDEFVEVDLLAVPLTERQSSAPCIVVVDRPALLELRSRVPAPVVCLGPSDDSSALWSVQVHEAQSTDHAEFLNAVEIAPPRFDWLEPFERLGAALAELRDGRQAA
jgi:hypothetical protein